MSLLPPLPHHGYWAVIRQFIRFGCVGAVGFLVDFGSSAALGYMMNFYPAAILAYIIAATNNWFLNRLWTFKKASQDTHTASQQWQIFLLANLPGLIVNRGIIFVLTGFSPFIMQYKIIAFFFGTLGGMFLNFFLSRRCVFHAKNEI